jgi:hypothetical protein
MLSQRMLSAETPQMTKDFARESRSARQNATEIERLAVFRRRPVLGI